MRPPWAGAASLPARALAFVFVSVFFARVAAMCLSGGFERVAFYNMYRASVLTYGKEHTRLVKLRKLNPGCGGDYAKCTKIVFGEYKKMHKLKEEQGNHKQLSPIDKQLRKAVDEILEIRRGENTKDGILKDFKSKFGVDIEHTVKNYPNDDETNPDKRKKVYTLDFEATLRKNPDAFGGSKNPLQRTKRLSGYVSSYGKTQGDTEAAKVHYNVLYSWDVTRSNLIKWCGGKPANA